jgi:K+-sensing histidine kinase KdpD
LNHPNTDENILVCVYYGPNGERLIRRGCKIAKMLQCPLYILTVDPNPEDELDIEKLHYVSQWKELAAQHGAEFIIKYNEKRPVAKVIGQVVREKGITQIIIGQTAHSRWEEITKRSFINILLSEIPFVDLHIVAISPELKNQEGFFEKGIRAYLVRDEHGYKLSFKHTDEVRYEGMFYKEVGTDFNNGLFKFLKDDRVLEVQIIDDYVKDWEQQIGG